MPNTAIHAIPYPALPAAGPGPDVPADLKAGFDAIDTKLSPVSKGLFAARPAFGKTGQRYYATDDGHEYLDIGTAWVDKGPAWGAGIVGTTQLIDDAVTRAKMADNSVGVTEIMDGHVQNAKLGDGSVNGVKISASLKPSGGAVAAAEALRALGTAPGTAAAGDDARLSDQRTPTDGSVTVAKTGVGDNGLARGCFSVVAAATTFDVVGAVGDLTSKEWDVSNWVDLATNRFTPQQAGIYRFTIAIIGALATASGTPTVLNLYLRKNGVGINSGVLRMTRSSALDWPTSLPFSFLAQANGSTDYFDLFCSTNTGSVQISLVLQGEFVGRT